MDELKTVAVIGAGRMGRVLALLSARAGFHTVLEDVLPSNLRKAAFTLDALHAKDSGSCPTLTFAGSVEEAARQADLILDSVPDELESKLEIFSLLDRMAPPRSILLTPTTALSIADLASCTYRPERCVGFSIEGGDAPERLLEPDATVRLTYPRAILPEVLQLVRSFWSAAGVHCETLADPQEARAMVGDL
jgi:3-hydroxybutyryl-CoA dehydrogenase